MKRKRFNSSGKTPPGVIVMLVLGALVLIMGLLLRREWRGDREGREVEEFFSSAWTEKVKVRDDGEKYIGNYENYKINFTLDNKFQQLALDLFKNYDPLMGVFVAMDAGSGALLAMASTSREWEACEAGTCPPAFLRTEIRDSNYPMASLVKIVTASAALESKIVSPDNFRSCRGRETFRGGSVHDPRGVAHGNVSIGDALGFSCNSVFSRLGVEVGRERLEKYLGNYMVGRPLDFDLPLLESNYAIDDSEIAVGRAGAGFGDVRLSPIHAAAIAASIQNGGRMMKPYFIEKIEMVEEAEENNRNAGGGAKEIYSAAPRMIARPVKKGTAEALGEMMRTTVNKRGGTAYRGFYSGGKYRAGKFRVVGKTGSLDGRSSNEQYTWMIGFVEEGEPKFAFATLVLNDGLWKIKAASFTGQFFKHYANEYSR